MTTIYAHELIVKGDTHIVSHMHALLRDLWMDCNIDSFTNDTIDLATALTVLQDDAYSRHKSFAGSQVSTSHILDTHPAIPELDVHQDDSGYCRSSHGRYILPDSDATLNDQIHLLSHGFPALTLIYITSYTFIQPEKQIYYYHEGKLHDHLHILYSSPDWEESRDRQAITIIRNTYTSVIFPYLNIHVDTIDDQACWTF